MVYILVLNWQGYKDTIECLQSLLLLTYQRYRIVVIDNDSKDESIAKLSEWCKNNNINICLLNHDLKLIAKYSQTYMKEENIEITLIQSDSNRGYPGGNNLGILYAVSKNADYIWIINNDIVAENDALTKMIDYFDNNHNIILGANLKDYYKRNLCLNSGGKLSPWFLNIGRQVNVNYNTRILNKYKTIDYVVGASIIFKADTIHKVGMFNEDYFLYFEEGEWCFRAKKSGYKIEICWEAVLYHKGAKSSGYASPTQEYYMTRNSLYFMGEYYPLFIPWMIISKIFYRIISIYYRRYPQSLKLIYYNMLGIIHFITKKKGKIDIR